MRAHDESTEKTDTSTGTPARPSGAVPADRITELQRTIGNAAVAGLIEQRADTVHNVLNGTGRPLDEPVRQEMEGRLGADLSDVRLHTGAAAQRSAREIGARAYTSGNHVVIGDGGGDPHTLAHELTHVIQQRHGPVSGVDNGAGLRVSEPSDRFEQQAESNARRVMSGPVPAHRTGPHSPAHVDDGETEPIVQRRVGFEFEAQWNVRDVTDLAGATTRHAQGVAARDWHIKVELLRRMINSIGSGNSSPRLTPAEQASGGPVLAQQWIAGNMPTPAGEAKLESIGLIPGSMQWDAAVQPLLYDSVVSEPPLLGDNLPKGRIPAGIVIAGTKFDLTADVSPTGGSNLEWVTDPLESTDQVKTVLGAITAMARYLNTRRAEPYIRSEEVLDGGGRPRPNLRIYPLDGRELQFAPQVTGGVRIDSLVELVGFLAEPPPSAGSRAANQVFTEGLETLTESLGAARIAVRANPQLAGMDTSGLVGLLGLIGSYLRTAASLGAGANPKSIAAGMLVRTDFAHNFSLLPIEVKNHLQGAPAVFLSLAMASAGLNLQTGPDQRVYPNTIERGLAGQRRTATLPLTRGRWLAGMLEGTDFLKNWDLLREDEQLYAPAGPGVANEGDWQVVHPSLGGLGTVADLVPTRDRDRVAALVVELRRMRGNRQVGDLKPLALATFDLFERLNLGKRLRFP